MQETSSFTKEAMVRGYHEYQRIWEASVGEVLTCVKEIGNRSDTFAIAVVKDDDTVGHLPRRISAICSTFIRKGGRITCVVTGSRRFSRDLPQGGLEIPCLLKFLGPVNDTEKAIDASMLSKACQVNKVTPGSNQDVPSQPPAKTRRCEVADVCLLPSLTNDDLEVIIMGGKLSDIHINYVQKLFQHQFPTLNGLDSTLVITKHEFKTSSSLQNKLQILHSRQDHWITASNAENQVNVYESAYSSVDIATEQLIHNLFDCGESCVIEVNLFQKQKGGKDCGLFAIASATALAFGHNPMEIKFNQEAMRLHLYRCIRTDKLEMFPSIQS